jgi:hypothetical protein
MAEGISNSSLRVAKAEELLPGITVLLDIHSPYAICGPEFVPVEVREAFCDLKHKLHRVHYIGTNCSGCVIVHDEGQQHLYVAG